MSTLFQMGIAQGLFLPPAGYNPTVLFSDVTETPLFLYSTARMIAGYSGPAYRVLRPSDSAEIDIGFAGDNRLDEVALFDDFLGSEVGEIVRKYDTTGNGNHTSRQETSAYRLKIGLKIGDEYHRHNGNLALYGTDARYEIPSLTVNRQNYSFYTVGEFQGPTLGLWQLGGASDPYLEFSNHRAMGAGTISPALCLALQPAIFEMHSTPAGRAEAVNGDVRTRSAATNVTTTAGITIGRGNTSYGIDGFASAMVGYAPGLSDVNRAALKAAFSYAYDISTAPLDYRVAILGDSITHGLDATALYGYAKQLHKHLTGIAQVHADGASGRKITEFAAGTVYDNSMLKQMVADSSVPRCAVIFLHTNDFAGLSKTGAEVYAATQTVVSKLRADGVENVIVTTPLPRGDMDAGQIAERNNFLTLIRGDHSFADDLWDAYADPDMGGDAAPADTSKFTDTVHPTNYGHSVVAPAVASTVNAQMA